MTSDLELLPGVLAAAVGRTGNELTFAFPKVLEVIKLCSANQIAVLGPDLFKLRGEGLYQTVKLSAYHLELKENPQRVEGWPEFVKINNALAEEFVRQNPVGADHLYILTTASWREFCEIQDMKHRGGR